MLRILAFLLGLGASLTVMAFSDEPCNVNDDWACLASYRDANAALARSLPGSVVFIGDSLTLAWAQEPFFKNNSSFVPRGISGQTAPQMLVRFRADVIALKPKVVHIMAGTNDVAGNTGTETDADIQGYLQSMVELARANDIAVVLASIPPAADFPWRTGLHPAPRIQRLNAWIRQFAAERNLIYADYWSRLATPDGAMNPAFSSDGVHLNSAGYAAMQPLASAAIAKALQGRALARRCKLIRDS